jgi:hypothetical protein
MFPKGDQAFRRSRLVKNIFTSITLWISFSELLACSNLEKTGNLEYKIGKSISTARFLSFTWTAKKMDLNGNNEAASFY